MVRYLDLNVYSRGHMEAQCVPREPLLSCGLTLNGDGTLNAVKDTTLEGGGNGLEPRRKINLKITVRPKYRPLQRLIFCRFISRPYH